MVRSVVQHRILLGFSLSCCTGLLLLQRFPFPEEQVILQLVLVHRPHIFWAIKYGYVAMLFTTPFILSSVPRLPQSLSRASHRNPNEAGFSAGDAEPYPCDGNPD